MTTFALFPIATPAGNLLTVRWVDLRTAAHAEAFRDAIRDASGRIKPATLCADWRAGTVLPPQVADVLLATFRTANPNLRRSAILLPARGATFTMQTERMVREANHPQRRTFRNIPDQLAWLAEVLSPDELTEATRFLNEAPTTP